jgi:ketosteroid isomerase-like protein
MTNAVETVRQFYAHVGAGNPPAALGLMHDQIEWLVVAGWPYKPAGRGPQAVAEGVLLPMMGEWDQFGITIAEVIATEGGALAVGAYSGVHKTTGKTMHTALAHLWDVQEGRLTRFRGQADTLSLHQART